jgi:hypothetical protein
MNWRDFLPLATRLAAGTTEADWRTAVSRAYYAAFHVARRLFTDLKFAAADPGHGPWFLLRVESAKLPGAS